MACDRQHTVRTFKAVPPSDWPEDVEGFLRELGGPAWIHVPGRERTRTRAVVTLMHGNEPSGVRAVHAWLRSGAVPAVDVVLVVGVVHAALEPPHFSHRTLFGCTDLNRCFLPPFDCADGLLAREILDRLRSAAPEALIDIHNTTGHTPPYGVGPIVDPVHLSLVAHFADRFVHSDLRLGALIEVVQDDFPAIVVECGMSGEEKPDRVAREGLESFLGASQLEPGPVQGDPVEVLEAPVRVCLQPGLSIGYGEGPGDDLDLTVVESIDRHNFQPMDAGATIGWVGADSDWPFVANQADGAEVSHELFALRDGIVVTRREFVPIMMTTDPEIAVQDCIFYAAHRRR